jgi:hypothetical protein
MHADASLYAGLFDGSEQAKLPVGTGTARLRAHVARGTLQVNGQMVVWVLYRREFHSAVLQALRQDL